MAIQLTNKRYCAFRGDYVCDYICDSVDDVASLPNCTVGSEALVLATNEKYVVFTNGAWGKLGGGEVPEKIITFIIVGYDDDYNDMEYEFTTIAGTTLGEWAITSGNGVIGGPNGDDAVMVWLGNSPSCPVSDPYNREEYYVHPNTVIPDGAYYSAR